jgi:hypothetical protein
MLVHTRWLSPLALVSFLAVAAPPAQSQCGPDGLDGGPCCAPTSLHIAHIPAMQIDACWICYDACQVTQVNNWCANIGPPLPMVSGGVTLCGAYLIRLRLRICGTTTFVWLGSMNAFYTRNWEETTPSGALLNVYRFVINGDMLPTPNLPTLVCKRPDCLNQYTRVYFSGYIDYALNCATNTWQVAFAISHECDSIHHQPGSARPAPATGLHPTRSFSVVAPSSTFAATTSGPMSDGAVISEAIRWNDWIPPQPLCTFEEPVTGAFIAQNQFCFCVPGAPPQYISTQVNVNSVCGSSAMPSPAGPFMQKRIGGWTSATTFPGIEFALFDFGWLEYVNGCSMTPSREWFEGGETIGGYPAHSHSGVTLAPEFEDLGSCNRSVPDPTVRIGAPHISDYLMYLNLP